MNKADDILKLAHAYAIKGEYEPFRAAVESLAADAARTDELKLVANLLNEYGLQALDVVSAFKTAALSAPAVPQWLPIETAPKDMLPHLFRVNGVAVEAFVDALNQLLVVNERREWRAMRGKPTHWMPLPATPQPQEQT